MIRTNLLFIAILLALSSCLNAQSLIYTQNTDEILIVGGASCKGGDSAFYRVYDFAQLETPTNLVLISGVRFAVEAIDGDEDITVNIFEVSSFPDGFNSSESQTLLTSKIITVGLDDVNTIIEVDFDLPVLVNDNSLVLIQIEQELTGNSFYLGVTEEETEMAFISSDECNIGNMPISFDEFGFPDSHPIIDLVVDDLVLYLSDIDLSQVSVYPNPSTDVLNVQIPSSVEVLNVSMFDILGKEVNVIISNGQVNISNLVSGVYLLNIESSAGLVIRKIIKK